MTYPLLGRIQAPGDVKRLQESELPALCEEIRQFLIESVSATGGHLSSNLGVVELTVALHRALDLPQDKILFDVGHQCYTHKLLTGRMAGFAELRQKNGLSGFPNPKESPCDTFIAGHGSAALSTAIGIARAKKLKGEPGKVVVIVGDGELQEGTNWEAIMAAAQFQLGNLVCIVDKNRLQMSGFTADTMNIDPLDEKFKAFGWDVMQMQGNDMEDVVRTFDKLPPSTIEKRKPLAIIAHTTKGCGVDFMENTWKWHGGGIAKPQLEEALASVDKKYQEILAKRK